jgi:hypothetical protein
MKRKRNWRDSPGQHSATIVGVGEDRKRTFLYRSRLIDERLFINEKIQEETRSVRARARFFTAAGNLPRLG